MKFAIMVTGAGKNKILGFMKSIIKDTILEKMDWTINYTNHSGRKTVVKKLKQANYLNHP